MTVRPQSKYQLARIHRHQQPLTIHITRTLHLSQQRDAEMKREILSVLTCPAFSIPCKLIPLKPAQVVVVQVVVLPRVVVVAKNSNSNLRLEYSRKPKNLPIASKENLFKITSAFVRARTP